MYPIQQHHKDSTLDVDFNLEKDICIRDPIDGHMWSIPRKQCTEIHAEVSQYWTCNALVPENIIEDIVVPDFLEPQKANGQSVLSLCSIFMRHAGPSWAPMQLTPASHNCALRVACIDTRDMSTAVWVDHRYSDSVLCRALTLLGFPAVHPLLHVERDEDQHIYLSCDDNSLEAYWERGFPHPSYAFEQCQDFANYFCPGIRSYGPGITADNFSVIDLHKQSGNQFQHMEDYCGDVTTIFGRWPIDSVYLSSNCNYRWEFKGYVDASGEAG